MGRGKKQRARPDVRTRARAPRKGRPFYYIVIIRFRGLYVRVYTRVYSCVLTNARGGIRAYDVP